MLEFVKQQKFERLGVFAYSGGGHPAAAMDNQIDDEVKQQRQELLMLAQEDVTEALNAEKVGKTVTVLVEGYDVIVEQYFGRTEADSTDIDGKVFFKSKKKLPRAILPRL